MGDGVLKRDILGLFWAQLLREGVGLVDGLNIMNLLNFRLHEEFILLLVHYFIYYTLTQLSLISKTFKSMRQIQSPWR